MPQNGGPTAQSGIYYQNSVAALFLGRLCDMLPRPASERIVEVRVEAPTQVDDTMVTYADGHHDWIQAKENLERKKSTKKSLSPWDRLWSQFDAQRCTPAFTDADRLVLALGTYQPFYQPLRDMCARANGAEDYREWASGLSEYMSNLAENVRLLLAANHQDDNALFSLFAHTEVRLMPLEVIERDDVPLWMPSSSVEPGTLFKLLRDEAGGHARYRQTFRAPQLLVALDNAHQVSIVEPTSSGAPVYRKAVASAYARISVPGTGIDGDIDKLFLWPSLREVPQGMGLAQAAVESEDPRYIRDEGPGTIDLRTFPTFPSQRIVIVGGAGSGKTALLAAIAHRLSWTPWLPVVISLLDLKASGETVTRFLNSTVNRRYDVAIRWEQYCDLGCPVLLFDGLDEVTVRERQRLLALIDDFSVRYERVPWLLTVRDATALSAPIGAMIVSVDAFDVGQIHTLVTAYRTVGAPAVVDDLLTQVSRYPDLKLLARIPLFLTLLLATARPGRSFPHKRSELLERYLHVLLYPEEYKPSAAPVPHPDDLREAAEHLAFSALEEGAIDLDARKAMVILKARDTADGDASASLEQLTVYGLLKRSPVRVSFVFPIVQEYLAACYLVRRLPDALVDRFGLAASRPWAQALQFALEQYHRADEAIAELLEREDDAFGTVLRLIGRCIVNGSPVSVRTRAKVGDHLANLWTQQSFSTSAQVGQILADGFTTPLPQRVRTLLESGWGFGVGGAEIVTACADPVLTRSALRGLLAHYLTHQYYLHGWQDTVNAIAPDALADYIGRARDSHLTETEIEALASLIAQLSSQHLSADAYCSAADDVTLPPAIRLSCYLLGPRPLPNPATVLADGILRDGPSRHGYISNWQQAVDGLWASDNPFQRWTMHVTDGLLAEDRRRAILFAVDQCPFPVSERLASLAKIQSHGSLTTNLVDSVLLARANLDDADAMLELAGRLPGLSPDNLHAWALLTSKYRIGGATLAGLQMLRTMMLSPEHTVPLARDLSIAVTHESHESSRLGGVWSFTQAGPHVATSECADLMWAWFLAYVGDIRGELTLLRACCEVGHPAAVGALEQKVLSFATHLPPLFDRDLDDAVSSALRVFNNGPCRLPLHVVRRYAELSDSGVSYTAAAMLGLYANQEALTALLELYNGRNIQFKNSVLGVVEQLAGRLGVRLIWQGNCLMQADTSWASSA